MARPPGTQTVTLNDRCIQRFAPIQGEAALPLRECGVMLAGLNEMFDPWEVSRSAPDFHVLFFPQTGSGWVECGGRRRAARPGESWWLPAGVAHRYGIAESPWKLFWFHLANQPPWTSLHTAQEAVCRSNDDPARLRMLLEGYIEESSGDYDHHRTFQAANAYAQLIALTLRRLFAAHDSTPESRTNASMDHLWRDVQNDLTHDWSIEEMAQRLHLSTSHFHRLVLERHEMAPGKLLQKFRMERARELIHHPDYTLDSIASLVGYQSGYALSRAFKAYFKVSPAQYRRSGLPGKR